MDIFKKIRNGEAVNMLSDEYLPAIEELKRANIALYHVNRSEPGSEQMEKAFADLFKG